MSHKNLFAIKRNGKTLGIKDIEQLRRVVCTSEVEETDKVYVISEKCWAKIEELPGWQGSVVEPEEVALNQDSISNAETLIAAAVDDHHEDKPVDNVINIRPGETGAQPTRGLTQLLDQLEQENGKSVDVTAAESAEDTSDYSSFKPKTIHKVKGTAANEVNCRRSNSFDCMGALREGAKPPVVSSVSFRLAMLVFILFLVAMVYGLYKSDLIGAETGDLRDAYLEYQANSGAATQDEAKN